MEEFQSQEWVRKVIIKAHLRNTVLAYRMRTSLNWCRMAQYLKTRIPDTSPGWFPNFFTYCVILRSLTLSLLQLFILKIEIECLPPVECRCGSVSTSCLKRSKLTYFYHCSFYYYLLLIFYFLLVNECELPIQESSVQFPFYDLQPLTLGKLLKLNKIFIYTRFRRWMNLPLKGFYEHKTTW